MPGSPQWSFSLRFPHQNSVHASQMTYGCRYTLWMLMLLAFLCLIEFFVQHLVFRVGIRR
jgi:hypothetical protein